MISWIASLVRPALIACYIVRAGAHVQELTERGYEIGPVIREIV